MPDEVKPDATRPAFRLRAALVVPAGWPPDVAPNQIITASHINAIKASVYAWPGNVDGQLHTLSNVHLVNATGVLADPTLAAGDLIARDAAAIGRLPVGGAGQVLTVDTALPMKLKWATPALAPVLSFNTRTGAVVPQAGDYTAAMVAAIPATLLTSKGDLIAFSTATGRMPAGIDGQVLRADAAATFGLRWAGESVPSVFTRTGPIVAQAGDYRADQVTNAVSVLGSYPDPVWLTSLSYGKLIGVPTSFTPAAHTHDAAAIVTGVLATARLGTGVADANVYLRGDGTWAAAGTGGGGGVISVFGRAGAVIAQSGDYTAAMVGAIPANLLTSTGDLLVRNNINQLTRLPIGANGQVLQTDLATSVGMKWTSISASVQTPWVTNIDGSNFDLVNVHRLGVALTVPNYPIDVVGDINYTGVLRSNGVPVVFGGSQTPWTQNINASGFSLNNAGTVGVGVAAPQAAPIQVATHTPGIAGSLAVQDLDATTSGNPVLLVTGLGSEGTRAWAVGCRGGATFLKDLYIWNDRSSAMLFGTNSAERMRITAAGNVGVGNTAATLPDASTADIRVLIGSTAASSPLAQLNLIGNAASPAIIASFAFANYIIAGADKRIAAINGSTDGADNSGALSFFTWNAGAVAERVKITAAGNLIANGKVGIGQPGPVERLQISGGNFLLDAFGDQGTTQFAAQHGIFFRDGFSPLGASGGTEAARRNVSITTGNGTSGLGDALDINASHHISFFTSGANERMRIDGGGNVGIGTTGPNVDLHVFRSGIYAQMKLESNVSGDTGYIIKDSVREYKLGINIAGYGVGQFHLWNATAARVMLSSTDTGVGILKASPAYPLDVAGDVNCSGVFRVNGTPVGGGVTTQNNVTGSRAGSNTVYQNTTGKPMMVSMGMSLSAGTMTAYSDAGNPPTTIVARAGLGGGGAQTIGVAFWVLPNNYYKVDAASINYWIEWY